MKHLLILLLLFCSISFSKVKYILEIDSCLHEKAFEIAIGEIGVTEATGKNDGPRVEEYLRVVGLSKGYPYCAAGISWCYYKAASFYNKPKSFIPFPMTAGSQTVYNYAIKNGEKSSDNVKSKDFFIWRKKDSYQGHIGIIENVGEKGWVYTIEFNTSNNSTGDQRDGGGVWRKKRNLIHPLGRLRVRGFVGFKKIKSNLCKSEIITITKSNIVDTYNLKKLAKKEEYSILEYAYINILKLKNLYV